MPKVIYLMPDCEIGFYDDFLKMTKEEQIHVAKNDNGMMLFDTLEEFQNAFNDDYISDLGFILFIE